jgi:hypothetical protein
MVELGNSDLVQGLIATLDHCQEAGHTMDDEIEALPIDVVRTSVRVLGMDPRLPPEIAEALCRPPDPAQHIINALGERDLEDDEITRLALDDVHAALNEAGINCGAGIGHIRELIETNQTTEATNTSILTNRPPRGENVVPLKGKRINRYYIAGIVSIAAAVACFLVVNRNVIPQGRVTALHANPDSTIALRDDVGRAFASNEMPITAPPDLSPPPPAPPWQRPPPWQPRPLSGDVARPMTAAAASSTLPPPPAAPTARGGEVYSQAFAAYQSRHYEEAVRQSLVCATSGNAQCMYLLGRLYADGLGAPRDYRSARSWYARSGERGYTDAFYAIALLEFQGGPGLKKDCAEGRKWLAEAVKHGAPAQVECRE